MLLWFMRLTADQSLELFMVNSIPQLCVLDRLDDILSLLNLNLSLAPFLFVSLFILFLCVFLFDPSLVMLHPQVLLHFSFVFIENELLDLFFIN